MAPRLFTADPIRLSRFVSIGRKPPGPGELDDLRRQGFRAVLDLRQETEDSGPLSPEAEGAAVLSLGLDYARVPVTPSAADDALLDRVDQELKRLPKPLLVHCASGRRAGMVALAHVAIEQGMSGASMLEAARQLDVLYGTPSQQRWFADYVDRHQQEDAAADPLAGTAPEEDCPTPLVEPAEVAALGPLLEDQPPRHPQRSAIRSMPSHPATRRFFGLIVAGTVLAAVVDRRLAFVPFLALGLAGRHRVAAWARQLAGRISAARKADAEIAALSGQLRRLRKSR